MAKEPNKRDGPGRPSGYNPETHPAKVLRLAKRGCTNYQIADRLGISRETLNQWRGKYPELSDALDQGRNYIVSEIEGAMYRRAVGGPVEETKTIIVPQKNAEGKEEIGRILRVERYKRYIPPSEPAAKLLLYAYDPERFRESRELYGKPGSPISIEQQYSGIYNLTPDDLKEHARKFLEQDDRKHGSNGKKSTGPHP